MVYRLLLVAIIVAQRDCPYTGSMIVIIAAVSKNGVIGRQNDLPWYLPADLKHFKDRTTGRTVVMGRRTYESIVNRLGHALPNRRNIVVTSRPIEAGDIETARSLDEALVLCGRDCYIIGGAQLYAATIEMADRLEITEVDVEVDGDVLFPPFQSESNGWTETTREHHVRDDQNPYDYDFVTYERVSQRQGAARDAK